jgi:hypothetical protein
MTANATRAPTRLRPVARQTTQATNVASPSVPRTPPMKTPARYDGSAASARDRRTDPAPLRRATTVPSVQVIPPSANGGGMFRSIPPETARLCRANARPATLPTAEETLHSSTPASASQRQPSTRVSATRGLTRGRRPALAQTLAHRQRPWRRTSSTISAIIASDSGDPRSKAWRAQWRRWFSSSARPEARSAACTEAICARMSAQ